jgi:caffeoyl-CoA O-methyltransferase
MDYTHLLDEYILQHSEQEPILLQELYREAHVRLLRPRMVSGHLQGRILSMLSTMIQPKRILEIGTFAGYSALCLAEGLPIDGKLITIEIDDEMEDFARSFFEKSPYKEKIELLIGDSLQLIPTLNEQFDLVFIDADKRDYCAYYEAVFDKVVPGGYIFADNTLWDGKVVEPLVANDKQTEGVLAFNNYIATDNRIEKVILPLRDGLTLIRKK